jgi:hypothetical protein
MAVAGQELADAERSRTVIRADDDDVAEAVGDELHPAQDERPQDDLAELAVGLHERQQALAIQLDDLARFRGPHPHERAAAGEHGDLAAELTRPDGGDERRGGAGRPDDLEPARLDHEERHHRIARFDEHLAGADRPQRPMRREPRPLRRRQRREALLGGRGEGRLDRRRRLGHASQSKPLAVRPGLPAPRSGRGGGSARAPPATRRGSSDRAATRNGER